MSNRKSAYGAPPEEKEVVVTVDRRVLYALGVLVLASVLVGGMLFARRSAPPQTAGGPDTDQAAAPAGQATVPMSVPEDVARATAMALGLPTNVAIVGQMQPLDSGTPDPFETQRAMMTPAGGQVIAGAPTAQAGAASNPTADALRQQGGVDIDIPEGVAGKAENWDHTVLAGFPDANLADEMLVPARTETVKQPLPGPRIGVAELTDLFTYDYGVVPLDRPVTHEFQATNVGDQDLIISRVYTGCGCTALTMGTQNVDSAGFLSPVIVLKPGQSVPFTVQFDPRAEGKTGAQAKYVQIYSNDPTKSLFDANDPNSAEVRFRFVVEPRGKLSGAATPTTAAP